MSSEATANLLADVVPWSEQGWLELQHQLSKERLLTVLERRGGGEEGRRGGGEEGRRGGGEEEEEERRGGGATSVPERECSGFYVRI